MAQTNIYGERTWRQIKFKGTSDGTEFTYIFRSNVPTTEVTDLGQTEISATPTTGAIISAARFPKPPRVYHAGKGIRTICATASLATAKTKGWQNTRKASVMKKRTQTEPSGSGVVKGALLVKVAAKTGVAAGTANIEYGWFMPKQQWQKITAAERTALGIALPADADWKNLCLGVGTKKSGPRPGRASITKSATSGTGETTSTQLDTVSTFYGDGTTLPAGWVSTADPIYLEI